MAVMQQQINPTCQEILAHTNHHLSSHFWVRGITLEFQNIQSMVLILSNVRRGQLVIGVSGHLGDKSLSPNSLLDYIVW